MNRQTYDFTATLADCDGSVFLGKVTRAVMDVSLGVYEHTQKGQVVITLDLDRIKDTDQVRISHTVKMKKPTLHGHTIEVDTTATPFHVGSGGSLSLTPELSFNNASLFDREDA